MLSFFSGVISGLSSFFGLYIIKTLDIINSFSSNRDLKLFVKTKIKRIIAIKSNSMNNNKKDSNNFNNKRK